VACSAKVTDSTRAAGVAVKQNQNKKIAVHVSKNALPSEDRQKNEKNNKTMKPTQKQHNTHEALALACGCHWPTMSFALTTKPWRVLKVGPRCVASGKVWESVRVAVQELAATHRVWVVVAAPYMVLEVLGDAVDLAAKSGSPARVSSIAAAPVRAPLTRLASAKSQASSGFACWTDALTDAERRCLDLARQLGLDTAALRAAGVMQLFSELHALLQGVSLVGHADPRVTARVLSYGPRVASHIAHAYFQRNSSSSSSSSSSKTKTKTPSTTPEGVLPRCCRVDTRALLVSAPAPAAFDTPRTDSRASQLDAYLNAHVPVRCNPRQALSIAGDDVELVVSQARTACNQAGETVMLGPGGNGGSAALVAAMLAADTLIIVASVAGVFTCNPSLSDDLEVCCCNLGCA